MTRISVVIPVRDDAAYLRECLAALAAQTRAPDELVVVDNGSVDDSAALARAAGARVLSEPVRGIPRASAAGYDAARGDVIARLDADSLPPPDWLARIEADLAADPGLDVVTGTGRFYGGSAVTRFVGNHLYLGAMPLLTPLFGHPVLFGSNLAMRSSVWARVGEGVHRERTDIHDDLDLSFHLCPDMRVRHDRHLVVRVSARPFASVAALHRRLSWVLPTFALHWPQDAPWHRLPARARARRRNR